MTESDWLAGAIAFDEVLRDGPVEVSERKQRLFLCACVRLVWPLLLDDRCRAAVEAAERHAEGELSDALLAHAWQGAWEIVHLGVAGTADRAALLCATVPFNSLAVTYGTFYARAAAEEEWHRQELYGHQGEGPARRAWQVQEALFRDVVGNPFRPVTLNPAWLAWNDRFVVRLAAQFAAERRFSDLPVLGDALEDAGCTEAAILEHCHGPGPHVPGCWIVDAVLGRH